MISSTRAPSLTPCSPSCQPVMTPLIGNCTSPLAQELSNTCPEDHADPTYWTVTSELGPTALPVPGVISLTTNSGGGVAAVSIVMVGSPSAAPVTVTPSALNASPLGLAAAVVGVADGLGLESEPQPASSRAGTSTAAARRGRRMRPT